MWKRGVRGPHLASPSPFGLWRCPQLGVHGSFWTDAKKRFEKAGLPMKHGLFDFHAMCQK